MKKRIASLAMITIFLIAGCLKDDFVGVVGVCPIVVSTIPTNGATDVPLNQIITVTFNVNMNPLTITNASLLINGSTAIDGVITYSGKTAFFKPNNDLEPNTTYTGTVKTTVKDVTGNALQKDYVWTFTTGETLSPFVITTDPENNEANVNLNKVVTATFNMIMDPLTLNATSFTIYNGSNPISGVVTYFGTTARFTPSVPFTSNTIYIATISVGAKNLAGTAMANEYVWTFSTFTVVPPTVLTTDPFNDETNVALSKMITATFSVPMDPLSITAASFNIKQGANQIAGTISYSGTTATFRPSSPLLANTTYTGTIKSTVRNLMGMRLETDYVWIFSTGTTLSPTVISTDPANNATDVLLNKTVTATFSEAMNPLTINGSSFTIRNGASLVSGSVTYIGTTASFIPSSALLPNTLYTATITTSAKNLAGVSISNDYVWTFLTMTPVPPTVIFTDPANNATGVALNKVVIARFSMPMDPLTIHGTSFVLKQGNTLIQGTISYSGITASFTPSSPFKANTIYTATITTEAKNLNGIALVNDYIWTFTTLTQLPPTVIATDPLNNSTGVNPNKTITATFSVAMDPTTMNTNTILLKQGTTLISGTVSYSGTTASFKPSNPLTANTLYTAIVTTGAKNLAGTALVNDYVWTFTTLTVVPPTIISTDPVNNATGVDLDKMVKANFSVPMDPTTISSATYFIKQGTTLVPGIISYSGTTATFTPTGAFALNTVYTATITTGAKNLAGTPLANDYVWSFTTKASINPPVVDLKSASQFGILAGVGISNNAGFSEIHDLNVGISPGVRSSVTGFPPAIVVNGAIYASDDVNPPGIAAMLIQAKNDLTAAYNFAKGASTPAPSIVSGDLGGLTLAPGIYKTTSSLLIQSGNLTLDAQGDPNAVWIFQIATAFTTVGGAGGSVILSGGAQAANVFWQTGSSATIGDGTSFQGNVLALTSITMNSTATAEGRMLAINGAVVMTNTNFISKP